MKVVGVTWVDQGMRVALPWQRGAPECSPPPGYWLQETKDGAVLVMKGQAQMMKLVGVVGVIHYGPDDSDDSGAGAKAPKPEKPKLP